MTAMMDEDEDDDVGEGCGHSLPLPCRLCQYERDEFQWECQREDRAEARMKSRGEL